MAARKRGNTADLDAAPDGALAPRQAIADPEGLDDDVERILLELGESASSVSISRESDEKPGRFDFLTRMNANEFTNEFIAREYGGGYYKIVITDAQQGPLNPVFFSVDRRIVGRAFNISKPASTSHGDEFKDKILDILLQRALLPPAPAPVNNDASTLDMALKIAALFQHNNPTNPVEMLSVMLNAATEMAKTMNPPEGLAGVASSMLPLMDKLLPHVGNGNGVGVRRLPAPTPTPAPVPVAPVTPVVAALPNPPVAVATTPFPKWLLPFKPFAPMLVSLADGDADPALYTEVILDLLNGDETAFTSAVAALEAGTLLEDVLTAVPALRENDKRTLFAQTLVEKVSAELRSMIVETTDEEGAPNGQE